MLSYTLNKKPLALTRETGVRMAFKNPACFHDSIPGNTGIGIEIPVNDHTRSVFGSPERFEKLGSGKDRVFPNFEIRFAGTLLERGSLVITNASIESYTGWLKSELGVLGEEQRDRFIDEMTWPEEQTFVNKNIYAYPDDNTVAPVIKNAAFWEEKGKQITEKIKYRDEDGDWQEREEKISKLAAAHRDNFGYLINQRNETSTIKTTGDGLVVSPMLFLQYALKEMLRTNKWFIDTNELYDNSVMRQLFIYNNFNIASPEFSYEEVPFVWEWDEETQDYIETNVMQIYDIVWGINTFNFRDLVPRVSLKDFLLGLQNYINYIFFFKTDRHVDIIDRNAIPEAEVIDLDDWFVSEWEIGERKDVRLKFISEYDKNDGIQGDDWHDLSDREDDFGDPVETLDDLFAIVDPTIGELRLVTEENKIYEWKWAVHTSEDALKYEYQEDVLKWEFVSTGPQHLVYGESDEIEEIKTGFSPLLSYFKAFDLDYLSIPITAQRGNLHTMRSLWTDFSPRLLFNIPLTGAATDVYGNYSLQWDGEKGLFEKRWKNWARFWKNRLPVEASFNLPLNMIVYIKNNIWKRFRTRHGTFIIEEMETDFSLNNIGLTRLKGYKI